MGIYLNPGNIGFERIVSSGYVDKTDKRYDRHDQEPYLYQQAAPFREVLRCPETRPLLI